MYEKIKERTTGFITYTSCFGEEIQCSKMEMPKEGTSHPLELKINIAGSLLNYISGAGEGVKVITTSYGFFLANDDESRGKKFFVRLLEDSKYYDGLKAGEYVLVESRGTEGRPVAIFYELRSKFGASNWD